VDANFDPTKLSTSSSSSSSSAAPSNSAKTPKPAAKQDVIFDITASQVQEIVIESPVPVLLDVYA
jgi:thioredoxin-like negative regulator of GroEL